MAVLTCGVGPAKAYARTSAALARWPADGVLSFGTCGGLVDAFGVGSVVTAEALLAEQTPCAVPQPWPGAARVCVTTVERPVFDPVWRDELASIGAHVCEMEAAAVQRAAGTLPFAALKVVSDMAGGAEGDPPARPSPADILRFKAKAMHLVETRLADVLVSGCAEVLVRVNGGN